MTTTDAARRAPTLVLPLGARRPEWLAERQVGIGSSDIAAILGLSPWASPYSLWVDKTMPIEDNNPTDGPLYWGNLLEAPVADAFQDRHPELGVFPCGMYAHADHPWARANPDRLLYPSDRTMRNLGDPVEVLEIKTIGGYPNQAWNGDDDEGEPEVPEHVILQHQWQMEVMDLPGGYIAGLYIGGYTRGSRLKIVYYERDRELGAMLLAEARAFLRLVHTGTPPETDGTAATTAALKRLWDVTPEKTVTVSGITTARHLTDRAEAMREMIKAREKKARAENALKALLGDGEIAVDTDGKKLYTWKESERRGHTVAATTYRRFAVAPAPKTRPAKAAA